MNKPAFRGQVAALVREFAKDVNGTLHQVFFGQPAGPSELGTPLAPTQRDVNDDLKPKPVVDNNPAKQDADTTTPAKEGADTKKSPELDLDR